MAMNVKKGDTVVVIAGDDKGKSGQVLNVNRRKGKLTVQGVNRVFRHLKPSRKHPQGGRIQKEMPINLSNVLPLDPKTNKATRVGFRVEKDGSKTRVAKKTGEALGTVRKAQ